GALEHRKMPRGNLGEQSRFRATADLYRAYTARPVPLICSPRERIILRDADGGGAAYQNSGRIERWRKQVLGFNEVLSTAIIGLDGKLICDGDPVWVRDGDLDCVQDDETDERRMVRRLDGLGLGCVCWLWLGRRDRDWCRRRQFTIFTGAQVVRAGYGLISVRTPYEHDLHGFPGTGRDIDLHAATLAVGEQI